MDEIKENGSLGYMKPKLSSALKKQLSSKYDCFDVYFETEDNKKNYFEDTSIFMTFDVNSVENLVVYKLTNNGKLIQLDYKEIGNNKIQIETTGLGKYILSYKEDKKDKNEVSKKVEKTPQTKKEISNQKGINMDMYISILGGILITISALFIIKLRRNKSKSIY